MFLILLGIVMAIGPGPGPLTILAGLWLLSADVRLAKRVLLRLRIYFRRGKKKYKAWRARSRGAAIV